MATRIRPRDRTKTSPRKHRWSKQRLFKKIPIFTTLVAICLGFLFFYQSTFIVSDNPHAEIVPQNSVVSTPIESNPIELESEPVPDNSKVGRIMSIEEANAIAQILGQANVIASEQTFEQTPKIILHDTSGELSEAGIEGKIQKARGPMGNGIAAYVSRNGKVAIARPIFFHQRRPTATVYEKAADILPETVRNQEARRVWQAIDTASRQIALKQAVAGLDVNNNQNLMQRASAWLNAPSERAFEALQSRSSTSLDGGKTTGLWAIGQICDRALTNNNSRAMATSPQAEKTLTTACQKLNPVLSENRKRVASSMHVEIVQKRGSECYTTDAQVQNYNKNVSASSKIPENRVIPLENWEREAYTVEQYQQVARLYLQAALQANRFPEITTHYWVDQGKYGQIGTHCDPRGFDLMRLYQEISSLIGHPFDTLYGIEPQYGLHPEKGDNVWWSDSVMGNLPPITSAWER